MPTESHFTKFNAHQSYLHYNTFDSAKDSKSRDSLNITQWNLSIMALQIEDTSIVRIPIDCPKQSVREMYTYILHVLQMHGPAPNHRMHCSLAKKADGWCILHWL